MNHLPPPGLPPSGADHPRGNAKLTADDVRNIRQLLADGVSKREVARKFEVCPTGFVVPGKITVEVLPFMGGA